MFILLGDTMTDIKDVLDQFVDYLNISTKSSIKTVNKYKSIVRLFLLNSGMEFTLDDINRWINEKNRIKNTYVYKYALRHFLISIGKQDLAEDLAVARSKPRKKVFKYITKDIMSNVLNRLPEKYQRIAWMQIKTGARIGTVLTLRAENFDFNADERLIYIKAGVNKTKVKRDKEITLKISKVHETTIKGWIKKPFGYIFLNEVAEHASDERLIAILDNETRYLNEELSKAGKAENIDNLSTHYLRHIYSDWFIKSGGDPLYLQKALGHTRIDTTMRYVSIADKMADKAILAMEDF